MAAAGPLMSCLSRKINVLIRIVAVLLSAALPVARGASLTDVRVFPADVSLKTRGDRQSIVVQAMYDDGVTRDVTSQASLSLANKKLAKLEQATLSPLADGRTELRVKFRGKSIVVPVKVERAASEEPISFVRDVMPVFTKAGCNAGACHGASRPARRLNARYGRPHLTAELRHRSMASGG